MGAPLSFLSFYRALWKGQPQGGEISDVERDRGLRVFLNDVRCELVIAGGEDVERFERQAEPGMEPQGLLAAAMQAISPELEKRIGNVEVFLDDAEISVVDSRQAKLSHFEGRALAEFGKYQLGGKPVCFASHRFGATSASETEKRVVAYIPEDRLTGVLFALGKLARFTTFFGPWSLQALFAQENEETQAQLTIHGKYATVAMANDAAGAVAIRNLPIGVDNLALAYGGAHGIGAHEAAIALGAKNRLAIGKDWPLPADAPVRHTGTFLALSPLLEKLSGEVAATADYFEFQRLAGRAAELRLRMLGSRVAGFATWLSDMLQIGVSDEKPQADKPPVLNLLEGMRTGLLKIGNQHFDFVGGRFVPSAAQAATAASQGSMRSRWKSASAQPVTLGMLKPYAAPLGEVAFGMVLLAIFYTLVVSPIEVERNTSFNLYAGTLARMAQAPVRVVQPAAAQPILWANDMITLGGTMPYDMKLTRLALLPGVGTTAPTFEMAGMLPKNGAENLQLVGRFMKRLSLSTALHRRFPEVGFAGVAENEDKDKESDSAMFKLIAKLGPGAKP